ncbi:MAG: hypothetical protein JO053_10025 [Acidobacteria bacterium]|nr:hypothetical protein [Acidobacteriota bacterium]
MASIVLENEVDVLSVDPLEQNAARPQTPDSFDAEGTIEELGIWLSGLQSYLHSPRSSKNGEAIKEFQVARSALQRCVLLNARLTSEATLGRNTIPSGLTIAKLRAHAFTLREAALAGDAIIRGGSLKPLEWQAWAQTLCERFESCEASRQIVGIAEAAGENYLPDALLSLTHGSSKLSKEMKELAYFLPYFGKILKWLSVIGVLLDQDEPVKASLVIFASVNDQVADLTRSIERRLACLEGEGAELASALDAAAYTAAIELKKVFSQELAGLSEVRPAPTVYARMETAYSLLNEGFQHMLADFARLIDGESDVFSLFPNFHIKLERSVVLRGELWRMIEAVRAAEAAPEKKELESIQAALIDFSSGPVRYLFYKDTETVERFIEEILLTRDSKDLVPLLHRFGAYLETLFGQVSLRAVLSEHPFQSA